MALSQPQQMFSRRFIAVLIAAVCLLPALQSCSHKKKVYQSNCNIDKTFKLVTFKQLIDHLSDYDRQYIEVSGRYEEGKGLSALFSDSLFAGKSDPNALWVNFSQDCPLYLTGTHKGLFEYVDGSFSQINNKPVVIRGMIDLHNKGYRNRCKATIDRVSLVKL